VSLSDALPVSVRIRGVSSSQGACTAGQTVTCSLGALSPGATATVLVTVRPIAPGRVAAESAVVSSELPDPDTSNNTASLTLRVTPAPFTKYVAVGDTAMKPSSLSMPVGWTVQWNFLGAINHAVSDATGMGLYATSSLAPGS
jgi:hypothetical protein